MTTLHRIDDALQAVRDELGRAMSAHPPYHSPHEGHSVIREELDELWDHVRADTGRTETARDEAIQIAATAVRYTLDLCEHVTIVTHADTTTGAD